MILIAGLLVYCFIAGRFGKSQMERNVSNGYRPTLDMDIPFFIVGAIAFGLVWPISVPIRILVDRAKEKYL